MAWYVEQKSYNQLCCHLLFSFLGWLWLETDAFLRRILNGSHLSSCAVILAAVLCVGRGRSGGGYVGACSGYIGGGGRGRRASRDKGARAARGADGGRRRRPPHCV